MEVLIKLDQNSSKQIFKPGGKVTLVTSKEIIEGILVRWEGGPFFDVCIKGTLEVKKINYLKCQKLWYVREAGENLVHNLKKELEQFEKGKKETPKVTAEDADALKKILAQIE